MTKVEPDYKALWQQMCERCDELDRKLAHQQQNLNCKSVQARLAAVWGFVKQETNSKPKTLKA